jgi:hypothetical protein
LAKNLEDAKPIARLDHLVKERYVRAIARPLFVRSPADI